MRLRERISEGMKSAFHFGGTGGGFGGLSDPFGWWMRTLPGTQYDYRSEAGLLWENAIFAACLRWMFDAWSESPMCVRERNTEGKWVVSPDHPAEAFFNNPSPYYDAVTLWIATLLSFKTAGNAYWYKLRAGAGRMTGVVYIPHWQMTPRWNTSSSWIDYYEYRTNYGPPERFATDDIVHLRYGIDPTSQRRGLRIMDSTLREICTENEAATYSAATLRNGGVPGVAVSPTTAGDTIQPAAGEKLKALWKEEFGGDRRGGIWVSTLPIALEKLAFSPADLSVDTMRDVPVSRICAAFGLDPMVVGLPSSSKTYSNYSEAREAAYESLLLPMHRVMGPQLDRQLLPEIIGSNPEKQRIGWDTSDVRALQDDEDALYTRLELACGGPFLTPNEVRKRQNLPPVEDGDTLREKAAPSVFDMGVGGGGSQQEPKAKEPPQKKSVDVLDDLEPVTHWAGRVLKEIEALALSTNGSSA